MQVGPQKTIKTIAAAISMARGALIIDVDTGHYAADVAVWQHDDITIRAMGGPSYYHNNRKSTALIIQEHSSAQRRPALTEPFDNQCH